MHTIIAIIVISFTILWPNYCFIDILFCQSVCIDGCYLYQEIKLIEEIKF